MDERRVAASNTRLWARVSSRDEGYLEGVDFLYKRAYT